MKQASNNLVFLALCEVYNKQCLFALLTLLNVYNRALPASIKIYVFTDEPHSFHALTRVIPINLVAIEKSTLEKWLNGTDYFLRAKICVVRDFLKNYSGNMVFVDTDVIFIRRLDSTFKSISEGKLILLLRESKLSSPDYKKYLSWFNNTRYILSSGRTVNINKYSEMWNSGLIGISSNHVDVIEDVLELCD